MSSNYPRFLTPKHPTFTRIGPHYSTEEVLLFLVDLYDFLLKKNY